MMRLSLLALSLPLLAAVALPAPAQDKKKEAKFDTSKLLGDWVYVSGVDAGEKTSKERLKGTVTFKKDEVTIPAEKGGKFTIAYKINDKTTPARIDMEIKDGEFKGSKAMGIIALDGKELKLCYVLDSVKDAKRPTKFESTKENKAFLFVLKPAK